MRDADPMAGHRELGMTQRIDAESHGTQEPLELEDKILTMASFKGGENSTDPRRCTAHSSQTGKRCKNASILGGRVCRYHGGSAPHVQKKAVRMEATTPEVGRPYYRARTNLDSR
jgi:hypothetical protein